MCGIVANLQWSGNSSLEQVRRGVKALFHRGPNGAGLWRSPGGHVTLGHARLSIMDLDSGDQPLANETGTIHCIVDGEFYDFEQIRAELESHGHRFQTGSDSEILIHLYEGFGVECVHHLRGEYAFVLWDEQARVLFAARDRFGIKPLYFSQSAGGILFASEVKALHAAGVRAGWDEEGFIEKLILCSPLHGRTLFSQVATLAPAHYLLAHNGELSQHRYWDFNYPLEADIQPQHSDQDYADQLNAVLEEAVRIRMRADVPIACYLSGGIDSGGIAGIMSRWSVQPVETFCLAFDDPACDESGFAKETAAYLEGRFTPIPITQASLAADLERTVWHGETLFTNAQCVAKFSLSRAVQAAGFSVVLTGEGADEILGGYPAFVIDSVFSERQSVRSPLGPSELTSPPSAFWDRLGYQPAWYQGTQGFLASLGGVFLRDLQTEDVYHRFLDGLDLRNQVADRPILNQSLYLYNRTVLPGHILTTMGDRMEMAHSIEARLPFLDHKVVEFSRSLPPSQKIRGFEEKFILRKAMRRFLPPAAFARRKFALQVPHALLTAGPTKELLHDTLRSSAALAIPFLHRPALLGMLDRSLDTDPGASKEREGPLMALLTTCLLGQQFHLS